MRSLVSLIIAGLAIAAPAFAQDAAENPSTLPTVSYAQIADGRSDDLPKGFIQTYETEFGYSVSVGDIVAVNIPTGQVAP